MITLRTTRHYVEAALQSFFPYLNLQKQTRLNNVAHHNLASKEYLQVVVINCLLTEIETLFKKKLVNTTGAKITLRFTDAQGVLFYQVLIHMPMDEDKWYPQAIRNQWIQDLDQEIIRQQIYRHNHPLMPAPPKRSVSDYFPD